MIFDEYDKKQVLVTIYKQRAGKENEILHTFETEIERELDMILQACDWIFGNVDSDEIENVLFNKKEIHREEKQ